MKQADLFDELTETEAARSLLDQLIEDSRLYRQGKDYLALLDFVVRLRNFAPFNAMLLQVQKPGLSYAASARDWRERFGRTIKAGARPLLILWPFGPVALVYDQMDTEGDPLPNGVAAFAAQGVIDSLALEGFAVHLSKKGIDWNKVDAGDLKAGSMEVVSRARNIDESSRYRMNVNQNHDANVQFATVAHELAHLCLGHLGEDKALGVPFRPPLRHAQQELEGESVSFIVCARNGVQSRSESYLASFVKPDTTIDQLDFYQVMRAAGQVEAMLGLTAHTKYDRQEKRTRRCKETSTMPQPQAKIPTGSRALTKKEIAKLAMEERLLRVMQQMKDEAEKAKPSKEETTGTPSQFAAAVKRAAKAMAKKPGSS